MRGNRQFSGPEASVKMEEADASFANALKMHWALEVLGLPDISDPNFEARVVYAAYQLGLLVSKKG